MNYQHETDYHLDAFRAPYELRAPRHRMDRELLADLEKRAASVTRHSAIHLNVYHMTGQGQDALPDHDVLVNTATMTYVVELHGAPICLLEEEEWDEYCPCDCHEATCPRCQQTFVARTQGCQGWTSCNQENCEYCGHYRDECAAGEITADLVERARAWRQDPNRKDGRSFYHQYLAILKGQDTLTTAESYAVAITEVFRGHEAALYPVVRAMLDREASGFRREPPSGKTIWEFEDGSKLLEGNGTVHTPLL